MGEFNNLVDEDVVWERTQGFGVQLDLDMKNPCE